MRDNALAGGGLGDAASSTRKHGRPSDVHIECQGCELGLSFDDDSHICYTAAGPAFNRTRTGVNTDVLRPVLVPLPCFPLLTPLFPHQFCNLRDSARLGQHLNGGTGRPASENNQDKENKSKL